MKIFRNGLATGLILQLAVGPVFFFIANLTLQKTIYDGFAGVLAVTLVDYTYITLAILGIGKLLEHKKFKKIFGVVSSIVLVIFGVLIIKSVFKDVNSESLITVSPNTYSSFASVFLITISSPMTIVFFTSLFTAKAVEYGYTKKELLIFGLGTGFATLLFMGSSVVLFSFMKESVPLLLIKALNIVVGVLIISYGGFRVQKILRPAFAKQ